MVIHLARDCEKLALSEKQPITDFDCGNADLNEFFNRKKKPTGKHPTKPCKQGICFTT